MTSNTRKKTHSRQKETKEQPSNPQQWIHSVQMYHKENFVVLFCLSTQFSILLLKQKKSFLVFSTCLFHLEYSFGKIGQKFSVANYWPSKRAKLQIGVKISWFWICSSWPSQYLSRKINLWPLNFFHSVLPGCKKTLTSEDEEAGMTPELGRTR